MKWKPTKRPEAWAKTSWAFTCGTEYETIKDKMLSKKILSEQHSHPLWTSEERPRRNPKKVRIAREIVSKESDSKEGKVI